MDWIERAPPPVPIAPQVLIDLTRRAIAAQPDDPGHKARLGLLLAQSGQFEEAAGLYEIAAGAAPEDFAEWLSLAGCYLALGQPEAALLVCERGEARRPTADLRFQRGEALTALERLDDARSAYVSAIDLQPHRGALRAVLRSLAQEGDGSGLLAFCDGLSQAAAATSLARAFRAIALSQLGRDEEAASIVDLERHVCLQRFAPPSEFGDTQQFNARLAADIEADAGPAVRENCRINYRPALGRSTALRALRDFAKRAMETYLRELPERGLDRVMPPPPSSAWLRSPTVILSDDGHNGAHIHDSYLSAVYWVRTPESVAAASDQRGDLVLGCCEHVTGGRAPCWGTRFIKPVPGTMVIFPGHFYHDVVPSRTPDLRISVAFDLYPGAPSADPRQSDEMMREG